MPGLDAPTHSQRTRMSGAPGRGINQHTLEKICKREPVRSIKLAKCLKVLEEYDSEQENR